MYRIVKCTHVAEVAQHSAEIPYNLLMDGGCDVYSSVREVFPPRLTPASVASD